MYKELERQLKEKKSDLSPEKVIEIVQSIYQIEVLIQETKQIIQKTHLLTQEYKELTNFLILGVNLRKSGAPDIPKHLFLYLNQINIDARKN